MLSIELVYCVTSYPKFGHFSVEIVWMIKAAFRDDSTNKSKIEFLYQHFKFGLEYTKNEPYLRRLFIRTLKNIECMQVAIKRNWWTITHELNLEILWMPGTYTFLTHPRFFWKILHHMSTCTHLLLLRFSSL